MTNVRDIGKFKFGVKNASSLAELSGLIVKAFREGWMNYLPDIDQEPFEILIDKMDVLTTKQTADPETFKQSLALTLRKLADRIEQEDRYGYLIGVEIERNHNQIILSVVLGSDTITAPLKIGFPVTLDKDD